VCGLNAQHWLLLAGEAPCVAQSVHNALQAELFRVPPNEAVTLDPQHRMLMEQTLLALADAGADAAAQTTGVQLKARLRAKYECSNTLILKRAQARAVLRQALRIGAVAVPRSDDVKQCSRLLRESRRQTMMLRWIARRRVRGLHVQ